MDAGKLYVELRPMLTALAYRMTGSRMDAEDIVQEAFIAFGGVSEQEVRSAKSYLGKMVANRCIDRLRSASKRREAYIGPWLPEPIVSADAGENDPLAKYVRRETMSTAYILLLQQLSWTERVVFLLREVFDYDYEEIAVIVEKSAVNCRQIFRRAKRSIGQAPEAAASAPVPERAAGLARRFAEAIANGNLKLLLDVLSPEAVLYMDGGGKVKAALRPLLGPERISRFFAGVLPEAAGSVDFRFAEVNGTPGIVAAIGGRVSAVVSFRIERDRIADIYMVMNPEKLTGVGN